MKILFVITLSELGGAQSVVVNLANKLCKDHDVVVAAGEGDGKMFSLLKPSVRQESIPNLFRKISPVDEIKAILQMRRLYNKYTPDIVHLHSSKAGLLGRLAFPRSKTVYTVHGFDSLRIAFRKFLPVERKLQYRCAAIVGVSKYDEKNLKDEKITNNVSFVYNGIFEPCNLDYNPFEKFNNFKNKVLCIARLSPQKNHSLFLEVAKQMPETAFIWIGNQHEPDFPFPKNVFFLGNIANAGAYAAFADVFILPSNYEGLPMVIIESMAKGIPIVASAVGGISELLDGNNGFAVKNDPGLFKEKIEFILNSTTDRRKTMGERAKETFEKSFTVDKMAEGYLKIYDAINNKAH